MVREGLRSGDVRTEMVPLREDGGGFVRRRRELSPRKRTPTPKGKSATPKSSRKGSVVSGGDPEDRKHVSSEKKSVTKKQTPVMKEKKKKDFTELTPLYKKAAQLDVQREKRLETESPFRNDSSVIDMLRPTRGRIATPRRPSFSESRPIPALSLPQYDDGVDLSDTNSQDDFEMEYHDEDESAADRPDSRTGIVDDTSMLDQSALENEEFTMVSIESLRQQNRGGTAQAADIDDCTHEQSSNGATTERRQAFISSPVVSEATPRSTSRVRTLSDRISRPNVSGDGAVNAFAGFGADSRRQLRSGLQLGQDLGSIEQGQGGDTDQKLIHYPRLPTPADSISSTNVRNQNTYNEKLVHDTSIIATYDMMSWQAANAATLEENSTQSSLRNDQVPDAQQHDVSEIGQTQLLEAGFDAERQNVRRQVLNANTSQIIVLSSSVIGSSSIEDNAHENATTNPRTLSETRAAGPKGYMILDPDGTAQDEWQAEVDCTIAAYAQGIVHEDESMAKTPSLRKMFTTDDKPTRAKIPRTWRRRSGVGFSYSDEIEEVGSKGQSAVLGVQQPGTNIAHFDHRQQIGDEEGDLQSARRNPASEDVDDVVRISEMSKDQINHQIEDTTPEISTASRDNGDTNFEPPRSRHTTIHLPSSVSHETQSPSRPDNLTATPLVTSSMVETRSPILDEPSDIRQLQVELVAATPGRNTRRAELGAARLRKRKLQSERVDEPAGRERGNGTAIESLDRLAPRRKYMRLLGSSPPSQSRAQSRSGEHSRPKELQTTSTSPHRPIGERLTVLTSTPSYNESERPSTFLSTLLSYVPFLGTSASTSSTNERLNTTPVSPLPLSLPAWTANHFRLLDKIYTLSLTAQTSPTAVSRLDGCFPAFSSPSVLPAPFADLIGITLHPHGVDADGVWRFSRPICERWCRVARAFCVEAARAGGGVPLVLLIAGEEAEADVDADDEEDDHEGCRSRHGLRVGRKRRPRRVETAWALAENGPRKVVEKICALWAAQARRVDRGRRRIVGVEGCEED